MASAGSLALAAAAPALAQDARNAQDEAAQDEGNDEAEPIVVLGGKLEESTPEELEKYGSRLEIVEGEAIDKAGYQDAAGALSLVPGLFISPKSGAFDYVQASLTGSRTSEVLFLVDGVRINNRLYASTSPLDTLPASMIERVEVLKGGQGLYYGTQAVGGIVNIVTRGFTSQSDGQVEIGYDTNEGYHLNGYARGGVGDHYFVGYISHDQAEGFQPFRDEDLQPTALDRKRGYRVTTLGGKYAFEPSDAFRLSASYQHTDARLDYARA
jgi:vitamin B12 transporter